MFQDWDLDLWGAKSTGWAFWAESQASGRRGALGEDLQMGKGRYAPAAVGSQRWEGDLPGKARAGVCVGGCDRAACAAGG